MDDFYDIVTIAERDRSREAASRLGNRCDPSDRMHRDRYRCDSSAVTASQSASLPGVDPDFEPNGEDATPDRHTGFPVNESGWGRPAGDRPRWAVPIDTVALCRSDPSPSTGRIRRPVSARFPTSDAVIRFSVPIALRHGDRPRSLRSIIWLEFVSQAAFTFRRPRCEWNPFESEPPTARSHPTAFSAAVVR